MWTASTIADFRARRQALTGSVAFVPTMGALHEGHLALMRRGAEVADHVLVSIFVNPAQFGPNEDLSRYPRTLESDLAGCESVGAAGVLIPQADEIYPPDQLACQVTVPQLTRDLEAAVRPGHFEGVCRVVAKLLNIAQADVACFGMKDYQQLQVVTAMAADLCIPTRIEPCPTAREPDGLALSSRNRYLNEEDRRHAVGLHKALLEAKAMVETQGEIEPARVEAAMQRIIEAHRMRVDYAQLRHPRTLAKLDAIEPALTGGVVALVAARLGPTRLIDNMLLAAGADSEQLAGPGA